MTQVIMIDDIVILNCSVTYRDCSVTYRDHPETAGYTGCTEITVRGQTGSNVVFNVDQKKLYDICLISAWESHELKFNAFITSFIKVTGFGYATVEIKLVKTTRV